MLTNLVIEGTNISIHSFSRKVGIGSSRQDLDGEFSIISKTSASDYSTEIYQMAVGIQEERVPTKLNQKRSCEYQKSCCECS